MRIEGTGATQIAQLMKALGHNRDVEVEIGTVVSKPPELEIELESADLSLDKDDLIVCQSLTEHTKKVKGGAPITFDNQLEEGDRVVLLAYEEAQIYIVVDKAVNY